jgi:ubiquinone/menaquinone biosynthesis C-methylase UbiE
MAGDAYGRLARWMDAVMEPLNAPLRDIVLRLTPPQQGLRVLDVGCGTGVQLERYRAAGCTVSGVDLSPAMLERARERLGADADLRLESAAALPYADSEFDVVLATLSLHEMDAATREAAIREMSRVLAPDGRVVITDFHPGPRTMPKGWFYRAISIVAETVARHRDRSDAFLAAGGIPTLASPLGLSIERTKVVSGGNLALYVLTATARPGPRSR